MRLALPVLVGADTRDRYHVQLAIAKSPVFSGPSLSEVLDDLALHLMESVPKARPETLASYLFCHDVALRKVKIEARLPFGGLKAADWRGRLSAVIQHWPGDEVRLVGVPRLSERRFLIRKVSLLEEALTAALIEEARGVSSARFDAAVVRRDEHLEVIEVDVELPTVLSSRIPKARRRAKVGASPERGPEPRPGRERRWVPPTTLRQVAVSLGHRALDGDLQPAFGREALVEQVVLELKRPGAAVLLVGPSGVGKTAIVHEVVRRMVDANATLTERVDLWELDGNRLIAGMSRVGAWEQRVEALVSELYDRDDVLVVDDLPTLVYTGRSAQSETHVAGFLEPHLARRELRILGECTPERLAAAREEAPGFFGHFRILVVPELDERQTLMVAMRAVRGMERDRPLRITPEVLTTILGLNRRFQAHHCQPGAAVTLLRRVVDEAVPGSADGTGRPQLDRGSVLDAFGRITGLPDFVLDPRQARPPEEIRAWFDARVLAQPNAASVVVDVICTLQQGLTDPHRPIAVLLLVGPTGVGKTETAKALASWLFGDPGRLLRFDMSEFRGPSAAARLVGDVHSPDGELTRRVAQQPFSVVLFDEIEKAHPAIFDVLLQVMGEGRLTNAVGRTTDLTSTIVLLTSNLGVAEARSSLGFGAPGAVEQDAHYAAAADRFFRPEFVNRLDRVVAYRALQRHHVGALVRVLVEQLLSRRGLLRSGVLVRVDPAVVDHIVDEGFEPAFGARALKRTLEARLTVPLARELVARPPGALSHVDVFPVRGQLELTVTALQPRSDQVPVQRIPEGIEGCRRLHAQLVDQLDQLQQDPRWQEAEAERSALLQQMQALGEPHEGSDPEPDDRFRYLSELIHSAAGLEVGLDQLQSESLASFRFEDAVDVEIYEARTNRRERRRRQVTTFEAVPIDTRRELRRARAVLKSLSHGFAELRYRTAHLDTPPDPVLVRVLPETPESRAHALRVAAEVRRGWERWGRVESLRLGADGWAPEDTIEDARALGAALVLHAPGVRSLLSAIEGFVLDVEQIGPDTLARLARLEILPPGEGAEPLQQLASADARWTAWRHARLEGQAPGASPRPVLPVSLRTGVDGDAPREGLMQLLLERCLALLDPGI